MFFFCQALNLGFDRAAYLGRERDKTVFHLAVCMSRANTLLVRSYLFFMSSELTP